MSRGKKRSLKKKQTNITSLEIGIKKYMRDDPLFGREVRRQERINNLFKDSTRKHRKEQSYISR